MAPSVSKFATIPFSCYELGHTWTPSCTSAAAELSSKAFKEGLKIYTLCYIGETNKYFSLRNIANMYTNFFDNVKSTELSLLGSRKIPRNKDDIINVVKDILRSSVFLGSHGLFGLLFCLIRKATGGFNFFTAAYIPALIASYFAILIEKEHRRPLLALYVSNVASETIFRMLRARNIVQNIKHFEVFLFVLSSTTLIYQMKKGNFNNDFLGYIFSKVLGSEEFPRLESRVPKITDGTNIANRHRQVIASEELRQTDEEKLITTEDQKEYHNGHASSFVKSIQDILYNLKKACGGYIHAKCQHEIPCLSYWFQEFWLRFLSGFVLQTALQLFSYTQNLISTKKIKNAGVGRLLSNFSLKKCLLSGIGFSSMSIVFRFFSCSLRLLTGNEKPSNGILPAVVASSIGFLLLRPPNAIGLYLFFKAAQTVISESHRRNNWKIIRLLDSIYGGGWCLLYAAATATLAHAAVMEPQHIKPTYFKFIIKVLGERFYEFNRHLLTVYGTKSNLLMMDHWPVFEERYLTEQMKALIKARKVTGTGNEFIKELTLKHMTLL